MGDDNKKGGIAMSGLTLWIAVTREDKSPLHQ